MKKSEEHRADQVMDPVELGRTIYHSSPENQAALKGSAKDWVKAKMEATGKNLKLGLECLIRLERDTLNELSKLGISSEEMGRAIMTQAYPMIVMLCLCTPGEFLIWRLTVAPFGLGPIETTMIALAINILAFEGVHLFLNHYRKQFPSFDNRILMVLGSVIFVAIFLMIFCGSDIRGNLFRITTMASISSSPEEVVKQAEGFYRNNSTTFIFLMVVISSCITLIGGISYSDLRNRIPLGIRVKRLYRQLNGVRNEMTRLSVELNGQEFQIRDYISKIEIGFVKEGIDQAELAKQRQANDISDVKYRGKGEKPDLTKWVPFLPVVLILVALFIFILLRGTARGETLMLFDMSISVGVKDYSGKETEFEKNRRGVKNYIKFSTVPGEVIQILGVTGMSFSRRYVLLEGKIAKEKGTFGEKIARDRVELLKKWKMLDLKPTSGETDLFGALQLTEVLFGSDSQGQKKLLVFSDMRHYGRGFDMETPNVLDVDSLFKQVLQKGLIPALSGVSVWCLGVHGEGKSPAYWKSLQEFWTRYFNQAGVKELKAFSMERRINHE